MENLSIPESDMLSTRVNFSNSIVNDEIIQNLTNFLVPVAFGIILTVGLVGNLLVIAVVRKHISKGSCGWGSYYWSELSACAALRRCSGTKCPLFFGLVFFFLSFFSPPHTFSQKGLS